MPDPFTEKPFVPLQWTLLGGGGPDRVLRGAGLFLWMNLRFRIGRFF